jgi:plastocyanin/uncharacterized membrane protein YozB (DUF420 family)
VQDFVGTRIASNINLAVQLLLLAGLLYGYLLARRKQFARHANVQTAMVLLNLLPIAFIMAPGIYGYAVYLREGGAVTFPIAPLMIGHGLLGLAVELYALYLVARMRTRWIPEQFRVQNIKLAMRVTLALWIVLVVLGLGIYADRFIVRRVAAAAPLLESRQLGADLYVHAVELQDAVDRGSLLAVKRHAEHLINLIEGRQGLHYGDNDTDGQLEDPGDGIGLLARLDTVATVAADPVVTAETDAVRGDIDRIITLSVDLLGAGNVNDASEPAAEILELAQRANGEGVFAIDRAARAAGVTESPRQDFAATLGQPGEVTIREDHFLFLPSSLTIPAGTTVTWINDERAKHTATADDGVFNSGDQSLGQSYSVTMTEPGVYPYFCRYHGDVGGVGMAGTIVVE